jgi:hypothetical protein
LNHYIYVIIYKIKCFFYKDVEKMFFEVKK